MPHLHSIYLTDPGEEPDRLPWQIASNIESLRFHHSAFTHTLYRNENGRAFIARHFGRDVLATYDELVPYSYKSDLLRFCLLFQLGGIYSDLAVHVFAPLETQPDAPKVRLFRDLISDVPWNVSTSLIYAPPGIELFENCIRQIVRNVDTGYYGFNPLCPTGPNLLGSQVAQWGRFDAFSLGEATPIMRSGSPIAGVNFLTREGAHVAVTSKAVRGLSTLGSKTRNDYVELYYRRKIYRRELDKPDVWTHDDYRRRGLMSVASEVDPAAGRYLFRQGCAMHGPFVALDAGKYAARFVFAGDAATAPPVAFLDVCTSAGRSRRQRVPARHCNEGFEYAIPFVLKEYSANVEVRLFLEKAQELSFDRLELTLEAAGG